VITTDETGCGAVAGSKMAKKGTAANDISGWSANQSESISDRTLATANGGRTRVSSKQNKGGKMTIKQIFKLFELNPKYVSPTMCWVPYYLGNCLIPDEPVRQWSPTFSAPGTGFGEDNFSMDRGWGGWFGQDSSA